MNINVSKYSPAQVNNGLLLTNFLDLDIFEMLYDLYHINYMRSQSTLNCDLNGKIRFFQN